MSLGGYVGGVIGGVIGFIASGYNPAGAVYGFSLGAGLGMMVDPVQPEVSRPDTADLSAPTATEGALIADVLGTTPVSNAAMFFWYADPRSEEETESAGGKGGGGEYVSGYKYYLSFAMGICHGRVDAVYTILENDNVLWPEDGVGDPVTIADATNGHVSLSVSGRGTIDFYFGTTDQPANALMTASTGFELPYPGLCYAVFDDFMIGNYNRVGSIKFIVRKTPEIAFSAAERIGDYDYNPAHGIHHMLVARGGLESTDIETGVLATVAGVLSAEERGISALMARDASVLDYLESLLSHVRGCLRISAGGLFEPVLFRADTSVGSMLAIDDDDILEEIDVNRESPTDRDNVVRSTYSKLTTS